VLEQDEYMKVRCKLDVYYPEGARDFATVIWFHAGGMKMGNRYVPGELRKKGLAVVTVDYRLHPRAKAPAYIEDAAAAVAWTVNNIETYGGSREKIFVCGASAGAYLATLICMDKRWLKPYGIDPDMFAGIGSITGQAITHFTVRKERGFGEKEMVIDELAPLSYVRKDCPPLLLVTGDRDLELLGRYEENAFFWRAMQMVGHPHTELHEIKGYDHGGVEKPAHPYLLRFINAILNTPTEE
jgi:acetyl esterase/lipase